MACTERAERSAEKNTTIKKAEGKGKGEESLSALCDHRQQ
jgi:hypothetical protein